ncbi:MAG: hypothetical protein U9Q70_07375, partial [Chloroflexota bacterium]|nr:hypothetical protein [Chloroflexota bacterium]
SLYSRLLRRHKSLEHTLLNWQAAQELQARDYLTDLFPAALTVAGGQFEPDLLATRQGEVYYVECERYTRKKRSQRARKWERYHAATGGDFYLVVPNTKAQNALVSEISRWVYKTQRVVRLYLSNLSLLVNRETEEYWTLEKRLATAEQGRVP